jgi:hypothetical protein
MNMQWEEDGLLISGFGQILYPHVKNEKDPLYHT